MSATLPNISDVSKWLNARLYITSYRPVKLEQLLKVGKEVVNSKGHVARVLPDRPQEVEKQDRDHVGLLT